MIWMLPLLQKHPHKVCCIIKHVHAGVLFWKKRKKMGICLQQGMRKGRMDLPAKSSMTQHEIRENAV